MGTDYIEQAVLGYMIIDNSLDSKLLNVNYFTNNQNKTIYKAIQDLKEEGKTVDLTMVTQHLDDNGLLASGMKTGVEVNYLSSLSDGLILGVAAEHHFKVHVNELITAYRQKEVEKLISNAVKEPDFLPEIKKIIDGYELEATDPIENYTLSAKTDQLQEFIEKKRVSEFWGLNITCFPQLTKALMGLREIIVLSAQPKVGKSTFMLQVASDIANQGAGVLYYDFENGPLNLMTRELCRKSEVGQVQLFRDRPEGLNIEGVIKHFRECKNFAIIADRTLNIEKIRSRVFQMRQMIDREDILIVIDSLQKLPMKDLKDRRAAIDGWLRDFEALKANDPHLTVLMVSELSREGQRPKESGDIEYTGHFLLRLENDNDSPNVKHLFLEYARDVEANKKVAEYETNFDHWKFEEVEKQF